MIALDKVKRKVPDQQHWDELARVSSLFMSPEEFLASWDVSAQELARIAGTSTTTVNHWFTAGGARSPQPYHKFRLALIHRRWTRL
jgi:DNA-binding transcriptional regulator YiaG